MSPEEQVDPTLTSGAPDSLETTRTMDPGPGAGAMIGRYQLLQKIGEGGMGEVWLAEQRENVRRRVALKVVKAGMNGKDVMARLEYERQALALMAHPAIAKMLDAGSTPDGAPYFVMEYVAGEPITTYCDNHRLSLRERLQLFIHVCEGVQHAHQKAIIHRDLKPSNILVAELDDRPAPKIIDFGIAKALGQRLTEDIALTRVGALVGTPEYMSPEQANSSGVDIDTRSDVYSLGIILYELLTGMPPLNLRNVPFHELLRRLRDTEPPTPSAMFRSQDGVRSSELARKRQTEPVALTRQMRGDLDSIALKALEKDRSRRYASPSDLAMDIGRYLRNEAVLAVPPSVAYRARKFARRHRAPLATAAAFVLVLVGAAVVSIRQRILAGEAAAVAQAMNDFLRNDLLAQASTDSQAARVKPDPDLKVRTALDRAAQRVAGKFGRQPEVEAGIRETIGHTYLDLGLYPQALEQLQRARELYSLTLGARDPKALKTVRLLGRTAERQGRYGDAAALYSQVLEMQRRVLGPEHPDTLASMMGLAIVYIAQGKYAEAEALDGQVVELRRRKLGPEHADTLDSMNVLANVYHRQGKYEQAVPLYRQVADIERRVLGPEHPRTVGPMYNLAIAYMSQDKYAEAEALAAQILEIRRHLFGPQHPDTLATMGVLASAFLFQGKYVQAEQLYGETLEIQRRVLGPEHLNTLMTMNNLADVYIPEGKYSQAEALLKTNLELKRRVLGPEHPSTLAALSDLADAYQRQGKFALSENYAEQALTGRRHALGGEHPATIASMADLALAYLSRGKFEESETSAREAWELHRRKQPDGWQQFRAESVLGASLAGQERFSEAERVLLEGYQGMLARKERIAAPERVHLDRAREWIVQLYRSWGKPAKAAEWAGK